MMEDDDLYSDEEGDFIPLISADSASPETKRKHPLLTRPISSFEIASAADFWGETSPSTKNKCLAIMAISIGCLGILCGCSLVRLGLSRMGNGTKSSILTDHSLDLPTLKTCQQRFNRTIQDVLIQITSHPESICSYNDNDRKIPRCACQNPLVPMARSTFGTSMKEQQWNQSFAHNRAVANRTLDHPYDVVFFGDSITNNWNDQGIGVHRSDTKGSIHDVFQQHFRKENGGTVDGVAFGIAGDRVSQVTFFRKHSTTRGHVPY